MSSKCTKLIHALSKSAKLSWGLSHAPLHTIYKGAILPLLLHGARIEALKKECKKTIYNSVQHFINMTIAKAFRNTTNEALCTLTGLTPIVIKAEEATKLYNIMRKSQAHEIDHEVQPKNWLHTADKVKITKKQNEQAIQIFTDASKSEYVVGAGIALLIPKKLTHHLRYTLHNRCSNNQAEQLAIVKALEKIGKLHINDNIPRIATVHSDSRITLQSLKNTKNNKYLIDKSIRQQSHWRKATGQSLSPG
jgi:ribonuclease HI